MASDSNGAIGTTIASYRESYNSFFNLGFFIDWGIAVIFLLYGLKLNLRKVLNNIRNWKLHLVVQAVTFVLFMSIWR